MIIVIAQLYCVASVKEALQDHITVKLKLKARVAASYGTVTCDVSQRSVLSRSVFNAFMTLFDLCLRRLN
jgi:hypothetical protein